MRIKKLSLYAVLIVGFVLTACISTSSEPEIVATRLVQAPTLAPPPNDFDLQTGAELFASSCAPCHGETGQGDGPSAAGFSCPMPAFAQQDSNVDLVEWFRIASNGKRSSDTCIMPPWSGRLNSTEIWQTVIYAASLRHDYSLAEQGADILTSQQTGDSPDYLTDTRWQVENSDAEILLAIQENSLEGFNFNTTLSETEQQAVIAYIRSQAYSGGTEVEVAVAQPLATEEVGQAQETEPAGTPEPLATEELSVGGSGDLLSPLDDISQQDTFDITGRVISGTAGSTLPDNLTLTLRVVRINEEGVPEEVTNTDVTVNPDKTFTFTGVPRPERAIASIETNYAGIRQFAPHIILDTLTEDQTLVEFTLYETTTEADLSLIYVESLIDAVSAEGASLTYQNFEIVNNSDRVYIGDENGRTALITFPTNAVNAEIDSSDSTPERFERIEENGQLAIYDTEPIFPGAIQQYTTRFNFPYNGSMTLEQSFPYDVEEMGVYISDTRGLRLESSQLITVNSIPLNDVIYAGFGLMNAPLPAGTVLSYRVFDGPNVASSSPASSDSAEEKSFLQENTTLILGFGVLLVVVGVLFMIYDLQRKKLELQAATNKKPSRQLKREEDALVAAIADLDRAYEKGKIAEDDYRKERERLKAELRRMM